MMERLDAESLAEALAGLPGWALAEDALAIERSWQLPDFVSAFSAMTAIALVAERMNHHPEWSNVYGRLDIRLTTHDLGGVSKRDLELARAIDLIVEGRRIEASNVKGEGTPATVGD